MKSRILCAASLAGVLLRAQASSPDLPPGNAFANLAPPSPVGVSRRPAMVESGANHAVWQTATLFTNANGRVVTGKSSYTELATSLNHLSDGQWVRSSEEISITPRGGLATNSAHRILITSDASGNSAVSVTLPSGETLSSHVFCLSYADLSSGSNVMIAQIQSSPGLLLPGNNRILFTNALAGDCDGDILYKNGISGLEQNIILRTRVSDDVAAQYGLNLATTVLQVWTEITGGPDPAITKLPGRPASSQGLAATLDDVFLDFKSMTIGSGSAFLVGDGITNRALARVTKDWVVLDNRRFLVEQVPLSAIAPQIRVLPTATAEANPPHHAMLRRPPSGATAAMIRQSKSFEKIYRLADAGLLAKPGFLVDYSILTSQTNLTLETGQSYLINGLVNVNGTLIIKGGACVKFSDTNNATLIATNVVCLTSDYLPTFFTHYSDNSVGEFITGSIATPTNYAGAFALDLSSAPSPVLSHLRFRFLSNAVAASTLTLDDVQILNCRVAIAAGNLNSTFRNVLGYNVQTFLDTGGEGYVGKTVSGENMTVHQCPNFLLDTNGAISLTNCVFAGVTNWRCVTTATNSSYFLDSDSGVFQSSLAGSHYLAPAYRDSGTSNGLNSSLLAELHQKTTVPPAAVYSNVFLGGDTILSPQIGPDTNAIDCGYHFSRVDYVFSGALMTNGVFTVQPGTVLGMYPNDYGYALAIGRAANFQSVGLADNSVRIAFLNTIQEQPLPILNASTNASVMAFQYPSGTAPQGLFRFTQWSAVGRAGYHFYGYSATAQPVGFRDCQFSGAGLFTQLPALAITNCSFDGGTIYFAEDYGALNLLCYNNLFRNGSMRLGQAFGSTWTFRDNVFDRCALDNEGGPNVADHNAYIGMTNYLAGTLQTNDITLTNFTWLVGPLGNFYQPSTSPFINTGSRTADLADLFHYTVTTNLVGGFEIPETNSIVDFGVHRVATDQNGVPRDSDGDSIPDYLESPGNYLDYYNGTLPNLLLVSGDGQLGMPGLWLPFPLVVQVTGTNGVPLTNAPFTFAVTNAAVGLSTNLNGTTASSLSLRSGSNGQASVYVKLPNVFGATNFITATAASGTNTVQLTLSASAMSAQNLRLWLRADAGVTTNGSGNISTWTSQGTNSASATQATGANQPLWVANTINGLPAVHFDGTNYFFSLTATLSTATQAEVFVVLKVPTNSPSADRGLWISSKFLSSFYPAANKHIQDEFASSTSQDMGEPAWSLQQPNLYNASSRTNEWVSRLNAGVHYTMATNTFQASGSPALGRNYPNPPYFYFAGDIAELLMFNRVLSTSERDSIGRYLNGRYAFVTNLPATPTNLIVQPVGTNQASLTWTGSDINQFFQLERKIGSNGTYSIIAQVEQGLTYMDSGLTPGTNYYYRVRAHNLAGESLYSNEAGVTTIAERAGLPVGSELVLWLDAGVGHQGGAVGGWRSRGIQNQSARQLTSDNRPQYVTNGINGLPVIRFNGSNSYFTLPDIMNGATQAEAFVVLRTVTNLLGTDHGLWVTGGNNASRYPASSGHIIDDFGTRAGARDLGVPYLSLDQPHLYNPSSQANWWQARLNAKIVYTSTFNNDLFMHSSQLGHTVFFGYFAGDIAELLIYTRILSEPERDAVGGYLAAKYALSTNIPPTPSSLVVTGLSATELSISWSTTNDSRADIERKASASAPYSHLATIWGARAYTDAGTIPETNYYYRVRCGNIFGDSAWVEITPPVVTVTNPVSGTLLTAGSNLVVQADAYVGVGSVTQVQFYAESTLLGTTNTVPFSLSWSTALQTSRYVWARALDNSGNTRISRSRFLLFPFDTDGDGVNDYWEIFSGANPTIPDAPVPIPGDTNAPTIFLDQPTDATPIP